MISSLHRRTWSAHIEPGREDLFNLIKSIPPTLKYEPGTIVADGDFVIVHGRFSGFGQPVNWIAADIVHIKNGVLVEHGCNSRRGQPGAVKEWSSNIRGQVSKNFGENEIGVKFVNRICSR